MILYNILYKCGCNFNFASMLLKKVIITQPMLKKIQRICRLRGRGWLCLLLPVGKVHPKIALLSNTLISATMSSKA